MTFNVKIVCIALVATAILLFISAPPKSYNPYFSAILICIALYVWFSQEELVRIFKDPKALLNYARKQPAGKLLPTWTMIESHDKEILNYKDFFIYIWFDKRLGKNRAFVLNRIVRYANVLISKVWSLNVRQEATSDWEKKIVEEAFGKQERKSESDMVDALREKGYLVKYKGKNKDEDDDDE